MSAAFDWYVESSPAAAASLLGQIDSAMPRIEATPETWPNHIHDTRRFLLRVFPFQIVYRTRLDIIEVLAFAHDKRKPAPFRYAVWERFASCSQKRSLPGTN